MKELLTKAWNTQTNTNKGLFDMNKNVFIENCQYNWDDWPYEQGALHVSFAGRNDIAILPEKAFNTLPSNVVEHSFILHNMGGRQNEKHMITLFSEWNTKLNI